MSKEEVEFALRHLCRSAAERAGGLDDGELLNRFSLQHDPAAFEVLIWRHGPMVFSVCRRILGDPHEAQDAFQAVFLTLVQKARAISKRQSLGGWLHTVAVRTAMHAVRKRRRRAAVETAMPDLPDGRTGREDADGWLSILDEELAKLPLKYRTPLVLSYLQGLTNRQIAEELNCPIGTVFTRLSRGRDMLHRRLVRRGAALPTAALTSTLTANTMQAALSLTLVNETVRSAIHFTSAATALIPANVLTLSRGVMTMMWLSKLKVLAIVLILAVAGSGAGVLVLQNPAQTSEVSLDPGPEAKKGNPPAPAREALRYDGKTFEEWRIALVTELKPELRIEGIKALSAFGVNGYAAEATTAILDVVRVYDYDRVDDHDKKVLDAGRTGLVKIGQEHAIPALIEEVEKGKRSGKRFAVMVLREFGPAAQKAAPAVAGLLEEDATMYAITLRTLTDIDREGVSVPALADFAVKEESELRLHALSVLLNFGPRAKEAIPQVMKLVRNPSTEVRERALWFLYAAGADPKTLVPVLTTALKDKEQHIRVTAALLIGRLGPRAKDTVPVLVEAINHNNDNDELAAMAFALGKIGPAAKAAIPTLYTLRERVGGTLYHSFDEDDGIPGNLGPPGTIGSRGEGGFSSSFGGRRGGSGPGFSTPGRSRDRAKDAIGEALDRINPNRDEIPLPGNRGR